MRRIVVAALALSLPGCCCRPTCPPPCPAPAATLAPMRRASPDTLRQITSRLRVGMSYDETLNVLRPYMDDDGGALGSLGVATFFLKDGVMALEFSSGEAGLTEFADRSGGFGAPPPFITSRDTLRLAAGHDFVPEASPAPKTPTSELLDAMTAARNKAFYDEVYAANIDLATCLRQAAEEPDPSVAKSRHDACIVRFKERLLAAKNDLERASKMSTEVIRALREDAARKAPATR